MFESDFLLKRRIQKLLRSRFSYKKRCTVRRINVLTLIHWEMKLTIKTLTLRRTCLVFSRLLQYENHVKHFPASFSTIKLKCNEMSSLQKFKHVRYKFLIQMKCVLVLRSRCVVLKVSMNLMMMLMLVHC